VRSPFWQVAAVRELCSDFRCFSAYCDLCCWGGTGKRTLRLLTTMPALKRLGRRCCCSPGTHKVEKVGAVSLPRLLVEEAMDLLKEASILGQVRPAAPGGPTPAAVSRAEQVLTEWKDPARWRLTFAGTFSREEGIATQEMRTITLTARHLARNRDDWNKKHLLFTDSQSALGAACKGRSSNFPLLRLCRRLCAISLCLGVVLRIRWVPSEWNWADGPSRGEGVGVALETLRVHGALRPG
jgi:hypothetical protein